MSEMKPVAEIVQREPFDDGRPNPCKAILWGGDNAEDDFLVGTKLYTIPADLVLVPRELLARVEESLRCEIEERYAGTKDHPAIRPKYLRDIAEADELHILLNP